MTRAQKIKRWTYTITKMVKACRTLDAACNKAIAIGCISSNGPLYNAIWRAFETGLEAADKNGWVQWFIQENDCGRRGLKARANEEPLRPIRTPRQLAEIIVKEEG